MARNRENGGDNEGKGHRGSASVVVDLHIGEVYNFWRNLENLARFVTGIEQVRTTGPKTSHWVIRGPLGTLAEFDVLITRDEPERLVEWQSETGGPQFSGEARFEEVGPNLTRVEFSTGPARPGQDLSRALRRFTRLVEGREARAERINVEPSLTTVAPHRKGSKRKPGSFGGRLRAGPGFNDPLPENIIRDFEGGNEDQP